MPHRDFDAARAERERRTDPVTFRLAGEEFTCVLAPAVGDVFDLIDAPEPDSDAGIRAVRHALAFIEKLLIPGDRDRFRSAIRDPEADGGPVEPQDVMDVMTFLAREFTARPTEPSGDSSSGRRSAGPDSNGTTTSAPAEPSLTAL